jgi:hypothetical protein
VQLTDQVVDGDGIAFEHVAGALRGNGIGQKSDCTEDDEWSNDHASGSGARG